MMIFCGGDGSGSGGAVDTYPGAQGLQYKIGRHHSIKLQSLAIKAGGIFP
jgi:hypothetical protein